MADTAFHNLPAPAKLNLFLHVVGRQDNGYHLLQSVFMLIDWQDSLDFTLRTDGAITRSEDSDVPLPPEDLCVRAARKLQQATGCTLGAHIHLRKQIPAEAGMGGGSSDAATCLMALNRLWNLQLSQEQLTAIGLELGADVPFFLFGRNAWAEGIGEQLQAVELPSAQWVVVKPDQGVPTGPIFSSPELKRDTKPATLSAFVADADPFHYGHNDLQPVAERLCPPITQAIQWLDQQGLQARMTGSGSAVFARLPAGFPDADKLQQSAPDKNWKIRICSNSGLHPLLQWRA